MLCHKILKYFLWRYIYFKSTGNNIYIISQRCWFLEGWIVVVLAPGGGLFSQQYLKPVVHAWFTAVVYQIPLYTSNFGMISFDIEDSIYKSIFNLIYYINDVIVKCDFSKWCRNIAGCNLFVTQGSIIKVVNSSSIFWTKCLPSSRPLKSFANIMNRFSGNIILQEKSRVVILPSAMI